MELFYCKIFEVISPVSLFIFSFLRFCFYFIILLNHISMVILKFYYLSNRRDFFCVHLKKNQCVPLIPLIASFLEISPAFMTSHTRISCLFPSSPCLLFFRGGSQFFLTKLISPNNNQSIFDQICCLNENSLGSFVD